MRRIRYWISLFKRGPWGLVTALFTVGGGIAFVRDEFGRPPWQERLRMLPWLPDWPWHWWALAALVTALLALLEGAYRDHRDQERRLRQAESATSEGPIPGEKDAFWALQYLLNESVWAWKEICRVNRWEVVVSSRLKEFERAARDDGLGTRGFPGNGGKPVRIDPTHWIGAYIDPATANTPHGVATRSKSSIPGKQTYGGIRVSQHDVLSLWPKATYARRAWATLKVSAKLTWYQAEFEFKRWRAGGDRLSGEQ